MPGKRERTGSGKESESKSEERKSRKHPKCEERGGREVMMVTEEEEAKSKTSDWSREEFDDGK